jgi:hypothetical protein
VKCIRLAVAELAPARAEEEIMVKRFVALTFGLLFLSSGAARAQDVVLPLP